MSERLKYYDRLKVSLRSHFQPKKQTKVKKLVLLQLLLERMDSKEFGLNSLMDAYIKEQKVIIKKADHQGFYRTMKRAIFYMKKWFDQYYDRNPDLPIRFIINDNYVLETIVSDGYDQLSLEELNKKIRKLLRVQSGCIRLISQIRSGKAKVKHADRIQTALDRNEEVARELNKLSAAARRRT